MKKLFRSIAILCLVAAVLASTVSVAATGADGWIPDAFKDYVFDAEYYAAKYPDVAKEYGTSEQALYDHFLNFGVDEKKQGSPTFSVEHYLSYNGGLKTMFGKDYRAALLRYCDNRYPETVYQSAPNKFMGDTFDAVISRAESTASGSYNIGVSDTATNAGNGQYNVEALAADSTDLKQLWTFVYHAKTDSYAIVNKYTGTVLDVNGALRTDGTNVSTYISNGTQAQRWRILERLPGQYVLAPVHASHFAVLDIGSETAAGSNVTICAYNQTASQLFHITNISLEPVTVPDDIKPIVFDSTFYRYEYFRDKEIRDASDEQLYQHFITKGVYLGFQGSPVFDVAHYIANNTDVGADYYAAFMHYCESGRNAGGYKTAPPANLGTKFEATIQHTEASFNIGIAPNATDSVWNVQTVTALGSDAAQIWVFTQNPDGTYTIINKANPQATLSVSDASSEAGANIAAGTNADADALHSRWYLFERTPGNYVIAPAHAPDQVMSINGAADAADQNVQLETYNQTQTQFFAIKILGYTASTGSVWYEDLEVSDSFTTPLYPETANKHTLLSYEEISMEMFYAVRQGFIDKGFEIYSDCVKGELYTATLVNGDDFYHMYWSSAKRQLRIAVAIGSAGSLPDPDSIVSKGIAPTITQLKSTEQYCMGYVITLSDGSFIIVDGGYEHENNRLYKELVSLNGGEDNIVIRAWLITHAHNDHYECFTSFAEKYAGKVTLECFMYCPETPSSRVGGWGGILTWGEIYDYINKFENTKVLIVHTGMEFTFGNVKMEILFSSDDILIDYTPDNQNAISIVSRFYTGAASALLLSDSREECARYYQLPYYGGHLKSDICQAAHHGVENYPLYMYDIIRAPIMFYPCSKTLYNKPERDHDVRMSIKNSDYIEQILLHSDRKSHTVSLACTEDSDHIWDEGEVITEVTCEQNGVVKHTCTLCAETITKEIPAGHSYENGACTRCGAVDPEISQRPSENNQGDETLYICIAILALVVVATTIFLVIRSKHGKVKAQ